MSRVPRNFRTSFLHSHARLAVTILLLFFFLFFSRSFSLRAQSLPNYNWLYKVDLPTFSVSSFNTEDITIAIAHDRSGNIYTLSVGSGIDKRDSEGNLLQKAFISASNLDSPRDLVVDDQGFIYVADYLAGGDTFQDNGKIRVFDPSGNYLAERTILTSFYRPLGLALSGENIYVAEYYDGMQGPEIGNTFSRVAIYNKTTAALLKETGDVDIPLRIAINSTGSIYVSQAGAANPAVLVFDQNLNLTGQLPDIISPGSVIVDALDFIHVIEYGDRIKFSEFINFDDLEFVDILNLAQDISTGTKNEEFVLKIYNPDGTFGRTIVSQLDFPVDIAQKGCGNLFVNNSEIFAGLFGIPSKLEFDLEVFKRIPSIDAVEIPLLTCPGNIEINVDPGETSVIATFSGPTATDNCGVTVSQTAGLVSGSSFPLGENIVEFTAEDAAGNKVTCSFTVLVKGEEIPPEFTDCPTDLEIPADAGKCGAVVMFELPAAFDESGKIEVKQTKGLSSGTLFPVGETVQVFEAIDDDGNKVTCSFTVTVVDAISPEAECPSDLNFSVDFGVQGRIVDYEMPFFEDNCPGAGIEQIAGLSSGAEFPVGSTENIFVITDTSGNSTTCSFMVIITKNQDKEAPQIQCPVDVYVSANPEGCMAMATYELPEATDNSGEVTITLKAGPDVGDLIGIGTITVKYMATDAAGNTATCDFTITVLDNTAPVIENCPGDQQEVSPAEGFLLPDYTKNLVIPECSDNVVLTQIPVAGTFISETTTITIFAEDEAGNISSECSFDVLLTSEEVLEITSCPPSRTLSLDNDCHFLLPDLRSELETSLAADIVQEPAPGTAISEETTVRFTATDADGNTDSCEVIVNVEDKQVPEISCPGNKEYSFDPTEGFVVPDFGSEAGATDNCNFELVQEPPPGSRIYASQVVFITAIDSAGNESFCDFELRLNQETSAAVEITSCPDSQVLELDADCAVVLPDLTGAISTSIFADVVQEPAPGTAISEETTVRFAATDADGNTDSCEIVVSVEDKQIPQVSCPGNKEYFFDATEGFVVPDFRSEAGATDNCNFEIVQEPLPGSRIYASQVVFITAIDSAGNESFCDFELKVNQETSVAVEITSCPDSQVLELDADCAVVLPDLTGAISTSISADIVQEPAPGTAISEETNVRFTATDVDGNTDSCEIVVSVEDKQVPQISCPGNMTVTWNPDEGYVLPDYTGKITVRENCEEATINQSPSPGTLLLADQEISFTVTDASGNSADCSFWLYFSEEEILSISCPGEQVRNIQENCGTILEDFTSLVEVNMENAMVTQEPAPGTPLSVNTKIIIIATLEGQQATCSFDLNLKDNTPPEVNCVGTFTLQLNEQGIATLTPEDIDNGSTDNCGIVSKSLSKTTFSADDVGEQFVVLTVHDAQGNESSCESKIIVDTQEDEVIQCTEVITLELNANRRAILNPRDLFSGGTGTIQFTVEKEEFFCADLGERKITFSYTTPTEEGTCEISIIVEDPQNYCQIIVDEPEDPGPFVIISPNPGRGLVEIFTSGGIDVRRAEVFDMRGRFLLAYDFSEGTQYNNLYSLDLTQYQSGIYTIKMDTNMGKYIRRAIIKND